LRAWRLSLETSRESLAVGFVFFVASS